MSYYLRWPASNGTVETNNALAQISGVVGQLKKVRWKVAETPPAFSIQRFLFDSRRTLDSTTSGVDGQWLLQNSPTGGEAQSTTDLRVDGAAATLPQIFNAVKESVCEFSHPFSISGGVFSFGCRFNGQRSNYGLAIYWLEVTDDNGVHTFSMASSNGTLNQFTSDTGTLTFKLFSFPVNNSHWVPLGGSAATFASSLQSDCAISANLQVRARLASSLQSVSTGTANLVKPVQGFASNLLAQSTINAGLSAPARLAAALLSNSNIVAAFGGGAPTFAATLGCSSALTAALTRPIFLASSSQSVSTIVAGLRVPASLRASLLSQSTATAVFGAPASLGATLLSQSSVGALLVVPAWLASNAQSVSTIEAFFTRPSATFAANLFSMSTANAGLIVPIAPSLFGATLVAVSTAVAELDVPNAGGWDVPTIAFNEPLPIREIALTFDQQGRPLVFYRVDNDTLKLYWFDAKVSQNVLLTIGQGINPQACFDYLFNVNYQESDALIAYARGNSVYYRIFRESFAVEHLVRTFSVPVYLESFGLIEGNRVQLAVKTQGACTIDIATLTLNDSVSLSASVSSVELIPDLPVPEGRQGYWVKKSYGAWINEGTFFDEEPGFKTSIKIKKAYKPYGTNFYICSGGFAIKSPTNQYYSLTFAVYEERGEIHVQYRGNSQKAPRMWSGDTVPLHKIEVEIRRNLIGKLRYYKERADGLGYEDPVEYVFPNLFTDPNNPPFETWPYEKTGFGGMPQYFNAIQATSNTIYCDFVYEKENLVGQWFNRFEAPLTQWNVTYQSGFYIVPYSPWFWERITEA